MSKKQTRRRKQISESERRKVWVKAGGRCVFCKRYLMEGSLVPKEMPLGEAAHVVGQQNNALSPRGLNPMTAEDRDKAENLALACGACHDEIDNKLAVGALDVAKLRTLKAEHEDLIFRATALIPNQKTLVLRVLGRVRGREVDVHKDNATDAILKSGSRFPDYRLSFDRQGIEIDLRSIPGEAEGGPQYFEDAKRTIDEAFEHRIRPGIAGNEVAHLSVFAFARLPILVYLGTRLDDTVPTTVYQRHRQGEAWGWLQDGEIVEFGHRLLQGELNGEIEDVVWILNVSGTIGIQELPEEVAGYPVVELAPNRELAHPDLLRRQESLERFLSSTRLTLSMLESDAKRTKRIHVFGALPVSAAVSLGRARDSCVHPALLIYDRRQGGRYEFVLEVQ